MANAKYYSQLLIHTPLHHFTANQPPISCPLNRLLLYGANSAPVSGHAIRTCLGLNSLIARGFFRRLDAAHPPVESH